MHELHKTDESSYIHYECVVWYAALWCIVLAEFQKKKCYNKHNNNNNDDGILNIYFIHTIRSYNCCCCLFKKVFYHQIYFKSVSYLSQRMCDMRMLNGTLISYFYVVLSCWGARKWINFKFYRKQGINKHTEEKTTKVS